MATVQYDPDLVGSHLYQTARMARAMPPAYMGAGVTHPYVGVGGERLGRVLPGRGLVLDVPLRSLGITHPVPHLYERGPLLRLIDRLGSERGAITTYDGIIANRAAGNANDVAFTKLSYTTVANVYSSVFQADGQPTIGTYTAGSGAAMNSLSTGAINALADPTGTNTKYLLGFGYTAAQQINMAVLVDLLVCFGGVNANLNTSQTVNSVALTRYTSGAGVLLTFDVTTALGATPANVTVTYTNQAGTAGRTTGAVAMTASAIAQRLQPTVFGPFIQFAAGDYGAQSVQSVIFSVAMGAGVVAGCLYYPLAFVPGVTANVYIERDATIQLDGLIPLVADPTHVGCLTMFVLTNTTSTGIITGFLRTVQG